MTNFNLSALMKRLEAIEQQLQTFNNLLQIKNLSGNHNIIASGDVNLNIEQFINITGDSSNIAGKNNLLEGEL